MKKAAISISKAWQHKVSYRNGISSGSSMARQQLA